MRRIRASLTVGKADATASAPKRVTAVMRPTRGLDESWSERPIRNPVADKTAALQRQPTPKAIARAGN